MDGTMHAADEHKNNYWKEQPLETISRLNNIDKYPIQMGMSVNSVS